jgi:DNA processing protein
LLDEQLLYRIGLTFLSGVGDVTAKKLVAYCGGAEALFKERKKALEKIPGIGPITAKLINSQNVLNRAEEEIDFIKKYNIKPLFYLDDDYPTRLKAIDDAPVMLYFKGNCSLNRQKHISVVGTRNASDYGKDLCEKLLEDLQPFNPTIYSGLAFGIDITAHKQALKNNLPTIGVVAHGLDRIYPSQHRTIAEEMLEHGGILTDFPSQTNPDRENFPKRNRIIAGISDATVVVEAGEKGGALITGEIANSYNRDVFTFPGRINDTYSKGCNWLIKTHRASLIESGAELAFLLGWELDDFRKKKEKKQTSLFAELSPEEKIIADILQEHKEQHIDQICVKTGLTQGKASMLLLNMEFGGIIKSLPGKVYQIIV